MSAVDLPEVKSFLNKMDSDMAQLNREWDAEVKLHDAILNYEKVFRVKIKIPLAIEEVKG